MGRFAKLDAFIAEGRVFARAEGTRRAYVNSLHRFETWCSANGLRSLPALPSTVERFCASLIMNAENPTVSPILNVIPAIGKYHELRNLPNPNHDKSVRDYVEVIRRQY